MIVRDSEISNIDALKDWLIRNGNWRLWLPEIYDNGNVRFDFGFDRPAHGYARTPYPELEYEFNKEESLIMGAELNDDDIFVYFIKLDDPNQTWFKTKMTEIIAGYAINLCYYGNKYSSGFPEAQEI